MAVRKLRAGVFVPIAMLGAGVMLSACSPVQMGAAAIVGNQRISQSTLSASVTDLQSAVAKYPAGQVQLPRTQMSKTVLEWLVRFKVEDKVTQQAGISVTPTQVNEGKAEVAQMAERYAQQAHVSDPSIIILSNGIGPKMANAFARYQAQELVMAQKLNGGKLPTTQAESTKVNAALTKATSAAAKALNVKINPQYGTLDPAQLTVVAGPDQLSKSAASAAPGSAGPGAGTAAPGSAGSGPAAPGSS